MRAGNLLDTRNGRFLAFGVLYISEGIPYGFTSIAMVTVMRQQGLSLEAIGAFVAALFLPWAFKWAWAPLIDLVKLERWGGRRAWIILCTMLMIVTLVITALVDFGQQFGWLMAMIVLNNIFCATQDVAIDSLAVSNLRPSERARGNGFMFGGQYLGITLGGGVAVFVYGWLGFEASLAYVCLMLAANLVFVLRYIHDPQADREAPALTPSLREMSRTVFDFVAEVYRSFWRSGPGPMVGVLFALLPHGAIALAYATLGTIQVDYGLNENQIAELRIYNTIAAGLGCLLGGFLGDRFGIKRSTAAAFVLTALPTLLLGLQISEFGLTSVPLGQFYGLVVLHGLFYGMAFALGVAIFMGMTNPVVAATQFTAFMAMSNLAISMGNYWQGVVAERIGYDMVFYVDAALVLLPLLVLPFVRERKAEAPVEAPPVVEPAPAPAPADG